MGLNSTFVIIKLADTEKVFTVQYQENTPHIFEQLFENWSDVEYLFDFFHEHITDLQNKHWQTHFGRILSVEEAIDITIEHASDFEEQILSLAQSNTMNSYGNALTEIFFPISNTYYEPLKAALKSYGTRKKSWLRIYAIQIQDVLIITGGAIKLTQTMQEREHTQQELNNLMMVANGLKRNHFTENTDFDFISFEL